MFGRQEPKLKIIRRQRLHSQIVWWVKTHTIGRATVSHGGLVRRAGTAWNEEIIL
jgi:hypothetical protein